MDIAGKRADGTAVRFHPHHRREAHIVEGKNYTREDFDLADLIRQAEEHHRDRGPAPWE